MSQHASQRPTAPSTPAGSQAGQPERSCGSCRLCCKLPAIPEMGKPADTWCPNANPEPNKPGCSIYADRPQGCRSFRCGWIDGHGRDSDRPDKLGVMMQPTRRSDGLTVIAFVEARPGALDTPRARALIRGWMERTPGRVVTRRFEQVNFRPAELRIGGKPMETKAAGLIEPKPIRGRSSAAKLVAAAVRGEALPRTAAAGLLRNSGRAG